MSLYDSMCSGQIRNRPQTSQGKPKYRNDWNREFRTTTPGFDFNPKLAITNLTINRKSIESSKSNTLKSEFRRTINNNTATGSYETDLIKNKKSCNIEVKNSNYISEYDQMEDY